MARDSARNTSRSTTINPAHSRTSAAWPQQQSQAAQRMWKQIVAHRGLLLMFLPGLLYFLVFHYVPMAGIVLAFKDYGARAGIWGSEWVGFEHFARFFGSFYASRIISNTIVLNLLSLLFVFPIPILLALLLNEIRYEWFKRSAQTISYFPYFVSAVVMVGIVKMLLSADVATGVVNQLRQELFHLPPINFVAQPELFRPIYILMLIWQGTGFGAIIYLASLAAVDVELYDAAIIDGAGRLQLIRYINLPALAPPIVMLLLLNISGMLRSGLETILLLYNPATFVTADVIETFVYRRGIVGDGAALPDYSFAAAVGLFQSLVGLILIVTANWLAKRMTGHSLW